MHIHTETAVSAIAIASTLRFFAEADGEQTRALKWAEQHDMGAVELYTEIAELAKISAEMANEVALCAEFNYNGFPGVYAYDVDEELGAHLWLIMGGEGGPLNSLTGTLAKYWLRPHRGHLLQQGRHADPHRAEHHREVHRVHPGHGSAC